MSITHRWEIQYKTMRIAGVFFDLLGAIVFTAYVIALARWGTLLDVDLPGYWSDRLNLWLQSFAVFFIYGVALEVWKRQTLIKIAFQLKVVDQDGGKPSVGQVLVRNVVKALEITLFPVALVAFLLTGMSFADRLAGTRVVRV